MQAGVGVLVALAATTSGFKGVPWGAGREAVAKATGKGPFGSDGERALPGGECFRKLTGMRLGVDALGQVTWLDDTKDLGDAVPEMVSFGSPADDDSVLGFFSKDGLSAVVVAIDEQSVTSVRARLTREIGAPQRFSIAFRDSAGAVRYVCDVWSSSRQVAILQNDGRVMLTLLAPSFVAGVRRRVEQLHGRKRRQDEQGVRSTVRRDLQKF